MVANVQGIRCSPEDSSGSPGQNEEPGANECPIHLPPGSPFMKESRLSSWLPPLMVTWPPGPITLVLPVSDTPRGSSKPSGEGIQAVHKLL